MRSALIATSSLVLFALASYACSSSDSTPATADAGKTSSTSSSSSSSGSGDDDDNTSSSSSSSGASSSGDSGASSSGDSGASSSGDSGASSSGAPVDGGTAGTKCLTGDQLETDANNDTQGAAQVLTATTGTAKTSFCGRLTAGDTDFFTYTFNVTGSFSYSGGASYSASAPTVTIIVDGTEYPFSQSSIPVASGKPVIFKLTSASAVDYHVSFNITQN